MSTGAATAIVEIASRYDTDLKAASFNGRTLVDVFEDNEVFSHDDEFTYTCRYTVEDEAKRRQIRARICESAEFTDEEADALIALLDEHDWDVSFLMDFF